MTAKSGTVLKQVDSDVFTGFSPYSSGSDLVAAFGEKEYCTLLVHLKDFGNYPPRGQLIGNQNVFKFMALHCAGDVGGAGPGAFEVAAETGLGPGVQGEGAIEAGMTEINEDSAVLEVDVVEFVYQPFLADFPLFGRRGWCGRRFELENLGKLQS